MLVGRVAYVHYKCAQLSGPSVLLNISSVSRIVTEKFESRLSKHTQCHHMKTFTENGQSQSAESVCNKESHLNRLVVVVVATTVLGIPMVVVVVPTTVLGIPMVVVVADSPAAAARASRTMLCFLMIDCACSPMPSCLCISSNS